MQVAGSLAEVALDGPVLLTIGTFDGVHRGHQFLLEQARERAAEHGYRLVIVTFDPCPAVVLRPAVGRYQLTTAAQKLRLLQVLDPALVAMVPFTLEIAHLTADQFMAELETRLELREMWLGEDFHFGRDREGGLSLLVQRGREAGFSLHVVARRMEEHTSISSTRVRRVLAQGDVQEAIPLLGRPFALDLSGEAADERMDGQLQEVRCTVAPHLMLPADGAYAVLCTPAGGSGQPAVADVQRGAPQHQVHVWPLAGDHLPCTLEFIEPLAASMQADKPALAAAARAGLQDWRRATYPAAGEY